MAAKKRNSSDGKEFEALTELIFNILSENNQDTTFTRNVQLQGADGKRQIDVLVESRVAGIDMRTIIECRDYNKRLDIGHVDGLESKMRDVKANKAMLVSRRGFSKKATSKANRIGITLSTLNNPKADLKSVGHEIPITVVEISPLEIAVKVESPKRSNHAHISQEAVLHINDLDLFAVTANNILEAFKESLFRGDISTFEPDDGFGVPNSDIVSPYFIRDSQNMKVEFSGLRIEIRGLEKRFYFGYISNLSNSIYFENLETKVETTVFSTKDLKDFKNQLTRFNSYNDLPLSKLSLSLSGISAPHLSLNPKLSSEFQKLEFGEWVTFRNSQG